MHDPRDAVGITQLALLWLQIAWRLGPGRLWENAEGCMGTGVRLRDAVRGEFCVRRNLSRIRGIKGRKISSRLAAKLASGGNQPI
jgi:hypothetical protein